MNIEMNLLRSRFFLLLACVLTFSACNDDDEIIDSEDNGPTTEWERPTEDKIQTRINKKTVVVGEFDEITERLLARIDGQQRINPRSGNDIPKDAELVIIDNNALLDLTKEQVEAMHEAYQQGTTFYLHKPNAMAAGIFYTILEDGVNAFDSSIATMTKAVNDAHVRVGGNSLYPNDIVVLDKGKGVYQFDDAWSDEPFTTTVIKKETNPETGEVSTTEEEITVTAAEPNEAEYGVWAESVAQWINQPVSKSIQTRAGDGSDELKQKHYTHSIPTYIPHPTEMWQHIPCKDAIIRYWVSDLYNFDLDQDYYHIVLEEEITGREYWKGEYSSNDRNKLGGFAIANISVTLDWPESNGHARVDQWNEQPLADGTLSSKETIKGWDINAKVGFQNGITGLLTGSYKHQENVTTLQKETNVSFIKDYQHSFLPDLNGSLWTYGINSDWGFEGSKWSNIKLKAPSSNSVIMSTMRLRQSLNYIIDGTRKRGNNAFNFSIRFSMTGGQKIARKNDIFKKWSEDSYSVGLAGKKVFLSLPVPNRFRHTYSIKADEIGNVAEYEYLMEIFERQSNTMRSLIQDRERCGKTEELLRSQMEELWEKAKEELSGTRFPNLTQTFNLSLYEDNNKVIGTIKVTPDGVR